MKKIIVLLGVLAFLISCQNTKQQDQTNKIKILIDTDANNELDDQHALAYAF